MLRDPAAVFAGIRHAGAVFLGAWCPEAVGDYVAGPNHVLPTSRTARFASGLSVFDFLKRTTWVAADAAALARVGPAAVALAEAEGLDAHARSIALRLALGGQGSALKPTVGGQTITYVPPPIPKDGGVFAVPGYPASSTSALAWRISTCSHAHSSPPRQ